MSHRAGAPHSMIAGRKADFYQRGNSMTLGLCMIVKDEEEVLGRCLESVRGVFDEINIVDTGSRDNTKRIASRYTDRIFDFAWNYDFAAARNDSFSRATTDYIMWLDADDVLPESSRTALIHLKNSPDFGDTDAYFLRYDAAFDGNGNPTLYFFRERILRRACRFLWKGAVHEAMEVHGRIRRENIPIEHRKGPKKEHGRNLKIFAKLFADGTMPDERQKFYFARELMDNGLYDAACSAFLYFLQGNGWREDKICACRDLAACHRLCGRRNAQFAALLQSFDYDAPRPEICCDLGDLCMQEKNYTQAIFWYRLALNEGGRENTAGFCLPDCRGYIPYMCMCVCYDRLGDYKRASACNEAAGKLKPQDANYLYNKRYFERRLKG